MVPVNVNTPVPDLVTVDVPEIEVAKVPESLLPPSTTGEPAVYCASSGGASSALKTSASTDSSKVATFAVRAPGNEAD